MDDEERRLLRKKERKLRRQEEEEHRRQHDAAQVTPSTPAAPSDTAADGDVDAERRRRKEERKERKRRRREQADAQTAAAEEPPPNKPSSSSAAPSCSLPVALSREDAELYRAKHEINISQADAGILPVTSFAQAGFPPALLAATASFSAPTPIQAQCWPVLLAHRDCIAIADTGSGKTLGFVLPGLVHILASSTAIRPASASRPADFNAGASGPVMLILSPTRELAIQTNAVCAAAAQPAGLRTVCVYGGVDKRAQQRQLAGGVHCVVATPGRLLGLIDEGVLSLRGVSFLVLDEADRLLDLGFEPDIRAIAGHIGRERPRQTVLFSATWPASVQQLAQEHIRDAVHISIGDVELKANQRVSQCVEVLVTEADKQRRLLSLLSSLASSSRVLLFVLYKREVEQLHRFLRAHGHHDAVAVSGDMPQHQREAALAAFRHGSNGARILIATDVVGRGLDIVGIDLVVNYTFPLTVEDYVHRIGRTGRAGKSGRAVTFFTRSEKHLSGELINVLRQADEAVPEALLAFGTGVKRKEHGFFGQHFKPTDGAATTKKSVKVKFDD